MVLVHKAAGPTSFRVMRAVQRQLEVSKAGHGGTLDPMASGLLIVLLGEATKLTPWIHGRDKSYRALIRFGASTNTLDAEGEVVERMEVPSALLEAELGEALRSFVGTRPQRPPKFSALKVDGRTHMSRARAGENFVVEERPARCERISLISRTRDSALVDLDVASGYYIRSFARDLGEALGVPAHLAALERTSIGGWPLSAAKELEELKEGDVVPITECVPQLPALRLDEATALAIRQGKRVPAPNDAPLTLALWPDGLPVAIVEHREGGTWAVKRGFALGR